MIATRWIASTKILLARLKRKADQSTQKLANMSTSVKFSLRQSAEIRLVPVGGISGAFGDIESAANECIVHVRDLGEFNRPFILESSVRS